MIPGNAILEAPLVGVFLFPERAPYNPTRHVVLGGVAVGDPSQGRQVQQWEAVLSEGVINVKPVNSGAVLTLSAPGATTVALAFDSNMGVTLAWQAGTTSSIYYFNSLVGAYVTEVIPGTTSCRLCVDDARDSYMAASDVIFSYVRAGALYWRQQRDRYAVERLVGATTKKIIRTGLSSANRLQFECQ